MIRTREQVEAELAIASDELSGVAIQGSAAELVAAAAKLRALKQEMAEAWEPIETAPKDGSAVDLRLEDEIHRSCRWSLCDRGWSMGGIMAWAYAPEGFRPTHWRRSAES